MDKNEVKNTSYENIKQAKLFTDGGSRGNPGPSACAYVLYGTDDNVIEKGGFYLGVATNNQAEYQALKHGLGRAAEHEVRNLQVFMDSLLIVNQLNGLYKVRNRDLWPIHQAIKGLCGRFQDIRFKHVPREENNFADSEVNRILDENKHH